MSLMEGTVNSWPLTSHVSTTERTRRVATSIFDLLSFTIPALVFLEINVGGQLFLSEVLLLALLPFLLLDKDRSVERLPSWIFALAGMWLLGQILTDFVRLTSFDDYIRGWSKILFMMTNLTSLFILISTRRVRFYLFGLGYAVGLLLAFFLSPDVLAQTYPWKFGLAQPLTLLVVLLACMPVFSARPIPALLLFLIGAVNLLEGSRGLAGVCFVTAVYLVAQSLLSTKDGPYRSLSVSRLLFAGLILATAAYGALRTYEYGASSGVLGEKAQIRYESQAGGAYGVVIGGRSEILVSVDAVKDSPVLGHGSWAKDYKYVSLLAYKLRQLGYPPLQITSGLIPTHSHLLGAWVEAGVLGAIFWVAIGVLVVVVLSQWYGLQNLLAPLVVYTALVLAWDILFSSFSGERRLLTPFYIIIQLYALNAMRQRSDLETES